MVSRFSGATLGLLAFAVTATAGVVTQTPVAVTLSRSIFALFLFYVLGLLLGGAAQWVIAEHETEQEVRIRERFRDNEPATEGGDSETESKDDDAPGQP